MSEERFKVWRNPYQASEPPAYMGELSPPDGSISLSAAHLSELGLPVGRYTIRVPESLQNLYGLPRWQLVEVR